MNRGFTLIELLAVIILLGIIALITVPIVYDSIENAEISAELTSAKQYINAVESYVLSANTSENLLIKDSTCEVQSDSTLLCTGNITIQVETKNTKVTEGTIVLEDYNVVSANFKIGDNNYTMDENGNIVLDTD